MADLETVHATIDHTGVTGVGGALAQAVSRQFSGAAYTTTSGTFADIDGTNLSLTMTTGARRVRVSLSGGMTHSSTSFLGAIDILVDGTGIATTNGVWQMRPIRASEYITWTFFHDTVALTAASHTIKLQFKTNGGTFTIDRSTWPLTYMIEELAI